MKFPTSLFSPILQVVPRNSFLLLVHECGAERHAKGFSSWDQYVAMLFCQLAQAKSLREISDGLAVTCGKLSHLGLRTAPAKSTLSYANAHRPWQLYQNTFFHLREFCRSESPGKKKKFRFKNKLLSLDSTTVDLCLSLFPWADFRQTKGAVKLHMLLDHDGYLPDFAVITDGKTTDVATARHFTLPAGSIVAIDRGYLDFELFFKWTKSGVFFVTRLKDNAAYEVVHNRPLPKRGSVRADQVLRFTGPKTKLKYPELQRRVVVRDERNQCEIELLTNDSIRSPSSAKQYGRGGENRKTKISQLLGVKNSSKTMISVYFGQQCHQISKRLVIVSWLFAFLYYTSACQTFMVSSYSFPSRSK